MKKTVLTALGITAALFAGQALAQNTTAPTGGNAMMMKHDGPGHRFEEADTNHDGFVTKDEFRAQGDKIFDRLDTNHDGKISVEEREAARKEHEAKRAEWEAKHGQEKPANGMAK